MKVGEIIQRIQSLYSKGVQSDSSRLTNRHIYNKFLTIRTKLLSEKAKKKQKISDWNYQAIPCIELIEVEEHECPCIPIKGCKVKRSKYKIPKVMSDYNNNLIDYVMVINNQDRFDPTNRVEMLYVDGNKYTAGKKRYILENGYIYTYGKNLPSLIKMRALFEDPLEALSFSSYCDEEKPCPFDIFEMEFPMDADQIDVMIELSVQEIIGIFSQGVEDLTNDNTDTQRVQPK